MIDPHTSGPFQDRQVNTRVRSQRSKLHHGWQRLITLWAMILFSQFALAIPSQYQYYILNPNVETGTLSVTSLVNDNEITAGNTTLTLDQHQSGSIPAGPDLAPGTEVRGTGPFSLGSDISATDLPVPGTFRGTQFVVPHHRSSHTYYLLSPDTDAQVSITVGNSTTPLTLLKGQVQTFDAGSSTKDSGLITSDQAILVGHVGNGGAWDAYPIPPAATELWGIRTKNVIVVGLEDNTTVTAYPDSGATKTVTVDAGKKQTIRAGTGSNDGTGSAIHLVADKPIMAVQYNDGDGDDTTAFWPTAYLTTHHALSIDAQYLAVACPAANTSITLTDGAITPVTLPCNANGTAPGKALFGSAAAGASIESDKPVYLMYDSSAANDEHNIAGDKHSYFVLNPNTQGGPLNVISLVDNNTIRAGSTTLTLNQYQSGVIPAGADLAQGTEITGSGAFSVGSTTSDVDLPVPHSFAATRFVAPYVLGSSVQYYFLSPYGNADITITKGATVDTISAPQGQVVSYIATAPPTAVIESTLPILVAHIAINVGSNADIFPVAPPATELWGIHANPSIVAALDDATNITVYADDGTSESHLLNRGDSTFIGVGTFSNEGEGSALHIVADKPVSAIQHTQFDALDATTFWSDAFLATRYALPVDAQFAAVVCPHPNTVVTLDDGVNPPQSENCFGDGTLPGKAYFGNATNGVHITAGSFIESNEPIYVVWERASDNQDINLLGGKLLNIPTPSAPVLDTVPGSTTNSTLTVTGTADPNVDVILFVNDVQQAPVSTDSNGNFSTTVTLTLGENTIYAIADNGAKQSGPSNSLTITYATLSAPVLNAIPSPTSNNPVTVAGTADPDVTIRLFVNGTEQTTTLADSAGNFATSATLVLGSNSIYAIADNGTSQSGPSNTLTVEYSNLVAPTLDAVSSPTNDNPLTITGNGAPDTDVRLYVNNVLQDTVTAASDGTFGVAAILDDGPNSIFAVHWDGVGEGLPSNLLSVVYNNNLSSEQGNQTITQDTVWTANGGPYTISTGDLTIAAGARLVLRPGTVVISDTYVRTINVEGELVVEGDIGNTAALFVYDLIVQTGGRLTLGPGSLLDSLNPAQVMGPVTVYGELVTYGTSTNTAQLDLHHLYIPVGGLASIGPGTVFVFAPYLLSVDIEGEFFVEGELGNEVRFVSSSGLLPPGYAEWSGMTAHPGSKFTTRYAKFVYCEFCLWSNNSELAIENTEFISSISSAVDILNNSKGYFRNNVLTDDLGFPDTTYGGLLGIGNVTLPLGETFVIENNIVDWGGSGISIIDVDSSVHVLNNSMSNNGIGMVIGSTSTGTFPQITGNTITENAVGIRFNASNPSANALPVNYNTISENWFDPDGPYLDVEPLVLRNFEVAPYVNNPPPVITVDALYNYWGTTDVKTITDAIVDYRTDQTRPGIVDFHLILDENGGVIDIGTVVAGDLTVFTFLPDGVYNVTGDIWIDAGDIVTIPEGAELRFFDPTITLTVDGTLNIAGTPTQPVLFSSGEAVPAAGDWAGIIVTGNATNFEMRHAIVEYADTGIRFEGGTDGNVWDSTIRFNNTGIYTTDIGTSPLITGSKITNNDIGVWSDNDSTPELPYNDIHTNASVNFTTSNYTDPMSIVLGAQHSWWGDPDVNNIATTITDYLDQPGVLPFVDISDFRDTPIGPVRLDNLAVDLTTNSQVVISGVLADPSQGNEVRIYINDTLNTSIQVPGGGAFSTTVTLPGGADTIVAVTWDGSGDSAPSNQLTITYNGCGV